MINNILKDVLEDLKNEIRFLKDHSGGREGCTYNDTRYDSVSTVYGYNLAIEHILEKIEEYERECKKQ